MVESYGPMVDAVGKYISPMDPIGLEKLLRESRGGRWFIQLSDTTDPQSWKQSFGKMPCCFGFELGRFITQAKAKRTLCFV